MTLRSICAWCQKVLVEGDAPTPVSHGLCSECEKKLEAEAS